MLQVVTKKYFRDEVPLHTTSHRRVLYTNRYVVTKEAIDLPVGSLQASASMSAHPFAFTVTVVEHLEAKEPDGSDAVLVATSGDELIDDLAAVLSFRTNSLFSPDVDHCPEAPQLAKCTASEAARVPCSRIHSTSTDSCLTPR